MFVCAQQKPQNTETHIFDSLAPFEWRLRIYNIILLCRLMCGILKHSFFLCRFFCYSLEKKTFSWFFSAMILWWRYKKKERRIRRKVSDMSTSSNGNGSFLCDCTISLNSRIKFKSNKLKSIHRWFDRISLLRYVEFNLTNRWQFINVFVESLGKVYEVMREKFRRA